MTNRDTDKKPHSAYKLKKKPREDDNDLKEAQGAFRVYENSPSFSLTCTVFIRPTANSEFSKM